MKLNLKTLSTIALTSFVIPSLSYSITTQTLNESLCSNILAKKRSPGFYRVHKPLTYENEGTHYFINKNKFFSLHQDGGDKNIHFPLDENTVDFFVKENSLWTLGNNLTERDLITGQIKNKYTTAPKALMKLAHATAKSFHVLEDKIYIAHGNLGLVVFDLSAREFIHTDKINTKNGRGLPSEAVSVSGESHSQLFIAMSSWHKGFDGITVYDATSKRVLHKMAYDKRRSGNVGPNAKIYHRGERVYLNNGGWIHAFSTKNILRYRKLRASWLPIAEEVETIDHHGKTKKLTKYRMIEGDLIFANGNIMGCTKYKKKEEGFNRPVTKSKTVSFKISH